MVETRTLKTLIIVTLMGLSSCKSAKPQWPTEEEYYLEAYKKSVLYGCLHEATNADFGEMMEAKNDLGLYTEAQVLFHFTCDAAVALGKDYSHTIETVSYPDVEGKKPIYSQCVSYAFGREVDSMARASYRKYKGG